MDHQDTTTILYILHLCSHNTQWVSVTLTKMYYNFLLICGLFPGGSDGKASAYNVGDLGSIPGLGRSPGEGNDTRWEFGSAEKGKEQSK